jgi:hypothetical protein
MRKLDRLRNINRANVLVEQRYLESKGIKFESYDHSTFDDNAVSNCCGAKIVHGDICAKCGEHCAPDESVEESFVKPAKPIVKQEPNKRLDVPVSPTERKTAPPRIKQEPNPTTEETLTEGVDPTMIMDIIDAAGQWINGGGMVNVAGESMPKNLVNILMAVVGSSAIGGFITTYRDEIMQRIKGGVTKRAV